MKVLFPILLALLVAATPGFANEGVLVADFNAPSPNNLQGHYGCFAPSGSELVYICRETLDISEKRGGDGSSVRLDYNVANGGAFNGFWMKFGPADSGNNLDASTLSKLTFWVKGDKKIGIPHKIKIELKGDPGAPSGQTYIGEFSSKWQKVEIPLKDFEGQGVDLSKLNEMVIVFEQRSVSPAMEGTLYIDDVVFQ